MMYEDIIQKYYNDIYRWSFAKTRNKFDGEDLTQEIIYQIIKTFSKNIFISEPEKYLWKIAYYVWCNKAKEYNKNKVVINNDQIVNQTQDQNIDIQKQIELEEVKDKLDNIISTFSVVMKNVVQLYYYDELKIKEIGEKLNMKDSLIKYYLYEARKTIKDQLLSEEE